MQERADARQAIARHRARRGKVRVIRAEARVDQRSDEGRIKGKVLMFVQRPQRVRLDVMSQFGPLSILTSDGERFALLDLKQNRYIGGATCPANIARMLGMHMSGEEVARVLLGDTPRITAEHEDVECVEGGYRMELRAADGTSQRILFEIDERDLQKPPAEQRLRLVRSELYGPDGMLDWRVTFSKHKRVRRAGVELPRSVRFEDLLRGEDTLVRFTDIDVNVRVPRGVFSEAARPGMLVEEAYCD